MTDSSIKRVALIGLGAAARNIHLPACAQLPEVQVVGGADPDPQAREELTRHRPQARAYEEATRMLDELRPDWVIVASPPAFHLEGCLAALERGVHVLCEKPFVVRSQDALSIVEAEARGKGRLALNLEFPRMAIFEAVLEVLRGSELGQPLFVQFWENQLEDLDHATGWRGELLTMREFGTHVLDLANEIYGGFPEHVYAQMARPGRQSGDLVDVVTLTYPGRRLVSIVLNRVCHGPHAYLEMRVDAERGSLRASIGGRARLLLGLKVRERKPMARAEFAWGGQAWLERGDDREALARNSRNAFADAAAAHLRTAMQAADRGAPLPKGTAYAYDIVRLCEAVYESAESGQSVRFERAVSRV